MNILFIIIYVYGLILTTKVLSNLVIESNENSILISSFVVLILSVLWPLFLTVMFLLSMFALINNKLIENNGHYE